MKYLPFLSAIFLMAAPFTIKNNVNEYDIVVSSSNVVGTVSPNIMGFNIVYCYEGDSYWKSGAGKIAGMMKTIGTRQFRYPGGTVVTKYHWEKPTGQGWKDTWDPQFDNTKNTSPDSFMDIDEYLEMTKKLKIDPLVGINMGSGMKYQRVQEGVDEAIRLMKHCLEKGVKVKYYYLDNEPYQHDANFTYTPEQYAEMVNTYVPAMKKIDPDIKIIVNTQPRSDIYIKPLLEKAGKNIDIVDVHMYWSWKKASFNNWKAEPMMTHQGKGTYAQQKQIWEKVFADAGYPDIKLAVLEWNIGPAGETTPPTDPEAALMIGEQFTQYVQSGLFMSCFWPISFPGPADNTRPVFNSAKDYAPSKAYSMFGMYTDILGQQQVSNKVSGQRLISLTVKSNDGKTMWMYLINKNQDVVSSPVNITLNDFNASGITLNGFNSLGKTIESKDTGISKQDASHYKLNVPKNSLVKLTFTAK